MTEYLVTPDLSLTLGEQTYRLEGSFGTLRRLQHAFQEDAVQVQGHLLTMRLDELARFIAIAANAPSEDQIGEALIDLDVTSVEYNLLKAQLMSWLLLALTPKPGREKKARELTATLNELTAPSASRGKRTKASA